VARPHPVFSHHCVLLTEAALLSLSALIKNVVIIEININNILVCTECRRLMNCNMTDSGENEWLILVYNLVPAS